MELMTETEQDGARPARRQVAADLIETTPDRDGLFHWVLASPIILFLAWTWIDLFAHYSPISLYWLDVLLGLVVFALLVVLPFGLAAFYLVAAFPRLFSHAGWDVQPLEPVRERELHMVRYRFHNRFRSANTWRQAWVRAAQGWVYLEIAVILLGGVLMVPVFFSATDFGFGR
jgi:hypothetical protein